MAYFNSECQRSACQQKSWVHNRPTVQQCTRFLSSYCCNEEWHCVLPAKRTIEQYNVFRSGFGVLRLFVYGLYGLIFLPSARRYSPGWALASSTTSLHCSLSLIFSFQPFTFIFFRSFSTSSSYLFLFFFRNVALLLTGPNTVELRSTKTWQPSRRHSQAIC
jgi:hypothetical protein